jgi:predicted RNase H-like HicB family nuclease
LAGLAEPGGFARCLVRCEERFKGGEVDDGIDHDSVAGMKNFTAVVERDPITGLLVGYIPGFPGAHSQAESLDELNANLREVVTMLLEDGEPKLEAEFVGTQNVAVG